MEWTLKKLFFKKNLCLDILWKLIHNNPIAFVTNVQREICNPFVLISTELIRLRRIIGLYYETSRGTTRRQFPFYRVVWYFSGMALLQVQDVHICRNEKKGGRWVKSWITWMKCIDSASGEANAWAARALLMCHLISSQRPCGSCCFGIYRQMSFFKYGKLHLLCIESHQKCLLEEVPKSTNIEKRKSMTVSHFIFNQFYRDFSINGTALMVPPNTHPF